MSKQITVPYSLPVPLWLSSAIEEEARKVNIKPERLMVILLSQQYQSHVCDDSQLGSDQLAIVAGKLGLAKESLQKRINGEYPKESVLYHD